MRLINEIIIHCSATQPKWMQGNHIAAKVAEIRRWHLDRGWSDIGYHYLVDRDGAIAPGRPVARAGAHVKGHNANSIGICLIGGHGSAETDDPLDNFTPQQMAAAWQLVADLRSDYPAVAKVTGHNDYAAKACPGFNVASAYSEATRPAAPDIEPTPSKTHWLTALINAILRAFK